MKYVNFYGYSQKVRVLRALTENMVVGITTIDFKDGAKNMLCLVVSDYSGYRHEEERITLYGNHSVLSWLREEGYKREYDFCLSYLYKKGINYIPSEYFYTGRDAYRIEEVTAVKKNHRRRNE